MTDRVHTICSNRILRVSMLLDPRFAYDNNLFTQENWKIVEQQLIALAKTFIFDNKPNPEVVADLSIPELQDNELEDDESRGSESISCKHNFIL
uniref:Uncharacterized protein n=1 Tax=Meloidogyne floridensis TaxID=298350 RepID=A0A915PER8_9BILA